MKNKSIVIMLIIALIMSFSTISLAASKATITIKASNANIKVGETFTVTLSASCEDGINGIDTKYSYDTTKLELVNAAVANSTWASLGNEESITVICNSTSKITNSDIYILTFKIKEEVEVGEELEIAISETMLDSDAATNSVYTLESGKIKVIVSNETSGEGDTLTIEKDNPDGGNTGGSDSDGDDTNTDNPNSGNENGNNGNQNGEGSNGNDKKDEDTTIVKVPGGNSPTQATGNLPNAGISSIIVVTVLVAIVIAILMHSKYKKLKDIK